MGLTLGGLRRRLLLHIFRSLFLPLPLVRVGARRGRLGAGARRGGVARPVALRRGPVPLGTTEPDRQREREEKRLNVCVRALDQCVKSTVSEWKRLDSSSCARAPRRDLLLVDSRAPVSNLVQTGRYRYTHIHIYIYIPGKLSAPSIYTLSCLPRSCVCV